MRIAVFSDVHGNHAALSAVLDDIARRGVDATIGLGDFLSGPFDPRSVADRIMAAGYPSVRGNHDRWLLEPPEKDWVIDAFVRKTIDPAHMEWLRALPATHLVDGEVFMAHGTPVDDNVMWMDRFTDDGNVATMSRAYIEAVAVGHDHPVLLCGHTHIPRVVRLDDGRMLVNPGTVGLPFLIGSPDARYAIIERRNGQWSAQLIAIPYDREPAIRQALALGYPGFATAIQTGWATLADL